MAAVIANEFTEAADDLYLSALIEIGLVLFVITVIVNAISRLLIWSVTREVRFKAPKAPAAATRTAPKVAA
jgi:phosphate transport system permease protein